MAVAAKILRSELDQKAWDAVCDVPDPEVPVLTIEDLGVLRDVHVQADGSVEVTITPTYTGCPAMSMFAFDIEAALLTAGFERVDVKTVLTPAWTTDWLSEKAREKLRVYGIAPPNGKASRRALFGEEQVRCPKCNSANTSRISEFGSTACKALYRCNDCSEPFDYFKCI
ncbi:putative 1,2-phenylacetyl-CoA epoxidase, subunit D [Pseudovibrio sp. W64]|uniref:1,2-phenylacetyl-CoA epoxidase subunit PaaD n=1 Tax=unclassified Pseudovibrio TaxID=2627060 RepID=UPI0007AEA59A|nr:MULTISPECIES: 1,2-phenylacetyl-CoA epoxidase subunit PaaD [unclassified Pseudovibrio]KZK91701.1 putative 1,2-phenylacetyl-CoA epoxidase, subunit D [Pseudovibrio sp. W64]KZL19794.1 putative 1,2-phenylacetyl-CoA epoxidase, subunit D [Pseudovibrio sp. WM33]